MTNARKWGAALRAERKRRKQTQAAVAVALGLERAAVCRYEKGSRVAPVHVRQRALRKLGIDPLLTAAEKAREGL